MANKKHLHIFLNVWCEITNATTNQAAQQKLKEAGQDAD